jgi:CheY-like chemotaxis protein
VTVDTAANDTQALALLNQRTASHVYDVVLIDGDLPAITKHNFAPDPAQSPGLPHPFLVLLTALDDLHRSAMVTDLGFDAHLTKPVKQARLFETVWQIATATPSAGNQEHRSRETASPVAVQPVSRMILLVEDNETNRFLVMRQLTRLGFAVEMVSDGIAAVNRIAAAQQSAQAVDLILMDVQMPGMDGLQATRLIRQAEAIHGGHVPIVAMTAYATGEERQQCLAAGMDDYLAKPVILAALQQVLERQIV